MLALPPDIAAIARFGRMTGWRRGEITGLQWSQVEWDDEHYPGEHDERVPGRNACIRIEKSQTKCHDARTFPLANAPELCDLLLERWRQRNGGGCSTGRASQSVTSGRRGAGHARPPGYRIGCSTTSGGRLRVTFGAPA